MSVLGPSTRPRSPGRRSGVRPLGLAAVVALGVTLASLPAIGGSASAESEALPSYMTPELQAMIDEATARQEEEAARRHTPAAEQQRAESASAFAAQSAAEALATATEAFPEQVAAPAGRSLTDTVPGEVEHYYEGDTQARVDVPGQPADVFLQSTLPLRGETDSGEKAPVDLSLSGESDGLAPQTPIVETTIPERLDEGVTLDDSGINFAPAGAPAASDAQLAGDTALFANVDADADFLARPAPTGAQAMWQLRSAESPESVELDFELPAGAALEEGGELGGARIVRGGEEIGHVTRPAAFDAEGWPVEVSFRIVDDHLVIDVPHRDRNLAYPILIDPVIGEGNQSFATNRTGWHASQAPGQGEPGSGQIETFYESGYLIVRGNPGHYQPLEHGVWRFDSPGTESTIYVINNYDAWHWAHGSVAILGAWKPTMGIAFDDGTTNSAQFPNSPVNTASAFNIPWIKHCLGPTYCLGGSTPGNEAWIYGGASGSGGTHQGTFVVEAAGTTVGIADFAAPTVQFAADTAEWVDDQLPVITEARDRGFGVKQFTLKLDSGTERIRTHACVGGPGDRCPNEDFFPSDGAEVTGSSFSYDTSALAEGSQHTLTAKAKDAVGNWSAPVTQAVKIDHTSPTLNLSGQLKEAADEGDELGEGGYDLFAYAQDGLAGVATIELKVDGEVIDSAEPDCAPDGQCPLEVELPSSVSGQDIGSGQHEVEVVAMDAAGNEASQSFEISVADLNQERAPDRLACTGEGEPMNFRTFSLGPLFNDLEASLATRRCDDPYPGEPVRANFVSHTYGVCPELEPSANPDVEEACAPPLEIQSWPSCERSLGDYELEPGVAYPSTSLGSVGSGALAYSFDDGTRVEIYTGASTVVIMGDDPAQVTAAIGAVHREPESMPPGEPTEPVPGSSDLPAPAEGSIEGHLSCGGGEDAGPPADLATPEVAAPPAAPYVENGEECEGQVTAPVGVAFPDSADAASDIAQDTLFGPVPDQEEQGLESSSGESYSCVSDKSALARDTSSPGEPQSRDEVTVWPSPEGAADGITSVPSPESAIASSKYLTECGWALDETASATGSAFDQARRALAEQLGDGQRVTTVYWGNTRSIQSIRGCSGNGTLRTSASSGNYQPIGKRELFGYAEHWARRLDLGDEPLDLPQVATMTEGAANVARVPIFWPHIQPGEIQGGACVRRPDTWGGLDNALGKMGVGPQRSEVIARIDPILYITGTPCWARAASGPSNCGHGWRPPNTSERLDDWRQFVNEVADRYPEARAIEIWNEPNLGESWGGCTPDAHHYAVLLRWAYQGVQAHNQGNPAGQRDIPVLTAGLSPWEGENDPDAQQKMNWTHFLDAAIKHNAALFQQGSPLKYPFDGVGLHTYRTHAELKGDNGYKKNTPFQKSANRQVNRARQIIAANGAVGLANQVWVTEVGVSTSAQFPKSQYPGINNERNRKGPVWVQNECARKEALVNIYSRLHDNLGLRATVVQRLVDTFDANHRRENGAGVIHKRSAGYGRKSAWEQLRRERNNPGSGQGCSN